MDRKTNAGSQKNRRTRTYIDKEFQRRFILVIVTFSIVAVVTMFVVGLLTWTEGAVQTPKSSVDLIGALTTLLLIMLVLIFIVIVYGLRFSHRIAGPVYALNRNMSYVKQGRLSQDLHLRDHDEFQSLAASFNTMLKTLRDREKEDLKDLELIKSQVNQVASGAEDGSVKNTLSEVEQLLDGLNRRKTAYFD